jgi:superfamily II DNA/RNA helicase
MAREPSSPIAALELASDRGFQSELASLRAKATLTDLLGAPPDYRWGYTAERAVRNTTALHLVLKRAAKSLRRLDEIAEPARVTAQAWESLAALEEGAARPTALMNAAVAYEIAGYQANAACLARLSVPPASWSAEPTVEGLASAFVQRLLLRVVIGAQRMERGPDSFVDLEDERDLGLAMGSALGARGLNSAARYLLSGQPSHLSDATELLRLAADGFAELGDIRRSNLMSNVESLLPVVEARSTWAVLGDTVPGSLRWQRYLRVLARGLGSRVLDSRSVSELWPSQLSALQGGLLDANTNTVVRLPTSSGKTRVAEMAIVHTLTTRLGSRCLYVAPFRALVSEVQESFANLFADLGYAATSVPGSYDDDVLDRVILAEDQVLVLTPEKLDLVLRLAPEALAGVELIVMDEGHIVGDSRRGIRYELLIARLRRRIPTARLLLLSAVIPQETLEDFAAWLGADEGHVVQSAWRPSIQRLAQLEWSSQRGVGVLRYDSAEGEALARFLPNLIRQRRFEFVHPDTGRTRRPVFPESNNKSQVAAALAYELAAQGPVLVFCAQTDWAQAAGNALVARIELAGRVGEAVPTVFSPRDPPRSYVVALEWLGEDDPTTRQLRFGIGVHHGRQPEAVRNAIEEDFRNRRLAVLAATTTLAQGVNLPVRTVVIHSVWRYDEETEARIRLPARDYWNIAGRAGRAGEETEGTIVHIVSSPQDRDDFAYYKSVRGDVEPVVSALYEVLGDLINLRISSEDAAKKLDAELLALLAEEAAPELDDASLKSIVDGSLVGVQARRHNRETSALVGSMIAGAQRIAQQVPDEETRKLFSSTGLRTLSCISIADHARDHLETLTRLLAAADYGDLGELATLLLEGLGNLEEMQPRSAYAGNIHDLLARWLEGRPVAEEVAEATATESVSRFIEEYFAYLLPWGISGYLRIAEHVVEVDSLSRVTAGFPSLVKYGVPTLEAAWAMAAGVAGRRAAMVLSGLYSAEAAEPNPRDLRRWLGDLNPEELTEEYEIPASVLADVSRALLRVSQSPTLSRLDEGTPLLPLTTGVRAFRRALPVVRSIGSEGGLRLRRDYDSPHRNATMVEGRGQVIGYLRRRDAQAVAPELDAGLSVAAHLLTIEERPDGRPWLSIELLEAP